ncbi:MAG: glycogen debranching N-terminal domain-containing protein, partial [Nitrospirota bacterium]|nr:glycogen debranching N-terminal domain-containing protein [Nitrospirota bacterium]
MAKKIIRVDGDHYILATSALADTRTSVLKEGDTFAIFNRYGDIQHVGLGEQGLYHEGTRFLSRLEFNFGTSNPFLLSSTVRKDNALFAVDLTNPDFQIDTSTLVPRGTLHMSRAKLLWQNCCLERIRFTNYSFEPLRINFSIQFEADFADIFEVRGEQRPQRGKTTASLLEDQSVSFQNLGLDQVTRTTNITCSPKPTKTTTHLMYVELVLEPKEEQTFEVNVSCSIENTRVCPLPFSTAIAQSTQALQTAEARFCSIFTENEQFNDWINRSLDDICMMTTELPEGPYPYAGVPWFSTVFGRDGIIAALECLWVNPELTRGVLGVLASTQAQDIIPSQDAEPGKILHETRRGEMAALGESPFERYYGSVDSTPLFILLAGAYY